MRSTVGKLFQRANLLVLSFVLATSGMSAAVPLFLSKTASAVGGVVNSSDMNGWIISNQDTGTVSGSFVSGPSGAGSLGNGSYNINSPAGKKMIVYNPSTLGDKLSTLSQLKYSTYVTNRDAGTKVAPAIDINAIVSGKWTTLVYEPTYSGDNTTTGQWQTWDALNGKWWSTKDLKDNSTGAVVVHAFNDFVPWSTITGLDSNAVVSSDGVVGGVQVVVGQNSGGSPWSNFNGSFDAVNINGTTYNFEPTPPAAPSSLYFTKNGSTADLTCGAVVNSSAGMTLHWVAPNGALNQYAITPNYPNNSGEYTYYPGGTSTSTWIGDNFGQHGQGTYSYSIKAQDANGQWGAVATCNIIYDTVAPVVTVTPVAGSLLHGTETFNITVTDDNLNSSAPNTWVYLYNSGAPYKSKGASVNLSSGHGTFTVDTTLLNDGDAWLDVGKLYDTAGNASGVTDTYFAHYTIDNTAPTVNFVSPTPAENDYVRGTVTAHVQATDNNGMGSYYIRVWKGAFESGSSNLVYNSCSSAPGAIALGISQDISCSIDTSGWSDGTYVISAQFLDGGANWGTAFRTIHVDNSAPGISWQLQPLTIYGIGGSFHVRPITSEVGTTKSVYIDFVDASHLVWTATNTQKNFDTTNINNQALWDSLSEGTHKFIAVFSDYAGNSTTKDSSNFVIDHTAPVVTVKPDFVGDETAKIFSNVSFGLYDANQVDKYVINGYTSDFGNNKWSDANFQNTKSHLIEGLNTFTLYDVAGNSTTYEFTYDSIAPVATINALANTANNKPTITGTIDDHTATVSLDIDGTPFVATNNGDGTWTYTVTTALADGAHSLVATGTDTAGNTTAPVATGSILVDTTIPTATTGTTPSAIVVTPQPAAANNAFGAQAVLGTQTTDTAQIPAADATGTPEVKGASDQLATIAPSPSSTGLAWYWWVLIAAAVVSFILWLIARLRNRANEA